MTGGIHTTLGQMISRAEPGKGAGRAVEGMMVPMDEIVAFLKVKKPSLVEPFISHIQKKMQPNKKKRSLDEVRVNLGKVEVLVSVSNHEGRR